MKITHLGHFDLPSGVQPAVAELPDGLKRYAKLSFGGRAMCLGEDGDSLWISGHHVGDLVAEVGIRPPGETTLFHSMFREVTPRAALEAERPVGLDERQTLDQLVGLAWHEGRLWALWQAFYDVDSPEKGRRSLWDGDRLIQIGDGDLARYSGYLTAHDDALWCGRSHGAGSAKVTHGPVLVELSGHAMSDGRMNGLLRLRRGFIDWTNADRYTALAFLPGHVVWLVEKAVGHTWYGPPVSKEGWVDEWRDSKGYHADRREVWLLPYTWPELLERPPIRLEGFHEASDVQGMAYSEERRRLYVFERYPPKDIPGGLYTGEGPRIWVGEVSEAGPGWAGPGATRPEGDEPKESFLLQFPGQTGGYSFDDTPEGRLRAIGKLSEPWYPEERPEEDP